MTAKRSVLVTDGEQRAALAAVRSLGAAGYDVHVVSPRPRSLAGSSRYATNASVVPDPLADPKAFAQAIEQLSHRIGASVVLPVSEAALLATLPGRDRIHGAMPFPSLERFREVCDKARVLERAGSLGIAVPRQFVLQAANDRCDDARFPVVVKASRSVVGGASHRTKTSVSYATNSNELTSILADLSPETFPVLVQERIDGPGVAISVLVWDGELRAAFAHRRLREKPPSGGVSVLRESMPLDRELLERSCALLGEFDWQGVAMVEFKQDVQSGRPYLMEINGRLWGSLQLAIDAGVDFPVLLVEAALGVKRTPVLDYPMEVRTRWEWGDVDHLIARLRRPSERATNVSGGRIRALSEFAKTNPWNSRSEVFRLMDPMPFIRESVDWLRRR